MRSRRIPNRRSVFSSKSSTGRTSQDFHVSCSGVLRGGNRLLCDSHSYPTTLLCHVEPISPASTQHASGCVMQSDSMAVKSVKVNNIVEVVMEVVMEVV
ncbi:hypothetical protein Q7C36_017005 [Tachysurus vachellii]|uniref:Uncharacterized protein n=1 Tax=Tachysurus vachellii TaxID=175792 RepID=A0AA88SCK1_TACVA|nr:hypothetical protein Q7C36_017005 [Tachysurus vachellii]